jgi:hypothetical protein
MWVREMESANVITGLFPQMYGNDKYDIDDSWQPRASVWTLEGTKGGKTYEWGPPPKISNYWDIETESQKRTFACLLHFAFTSDRIDRIFVKPYLCYRRKGKIIEL